MFNYQEKWQRYGLFSQITELSAYFLPQITCGELLCAEKMFSTEFSYCCGLVELREFEKIVNESQLFNIFCG
jgi:hypothetical protein